MSPDQDPRFWTLREALAAYASDSDDSPVVRDETLLAAVSLVLRGTEDLELLLIERARIPGDPWSGHMALPGGRREPTDDTLLDTAVRETREEVGIELAETGSLHLGRLEEVSPTSARLPSLSIHPFVFGVRPETGTHPSAREVASVHWVPVSSLRAAGAVEEVRVELRGEARDFPCFRVGGRPVWGLTYRILTRFLDVVPELLEGGSSER